MYNSKLVMTLWQKNQRNFAFLIYSLKKNGKKLWILKNIVYLCNQYRGRNPELQMH